MTDISYIGSQTLEAETRFEKVKYRIFAMCHRCGEEFSWVANAPGGKDRKCPRSACKAAALEEEIQRRAENLARMIETSTPPGHIGDKTIVKAIDTTAEVVMTDHKMTDLRDNLRVGDSMAPKLPTVGASGMPMRSAAEGFFGGANTIGHAGIRNRSQAEMLGRRAIAGAFRDAAVNPTALIPGRQGEAVLRPVSSERLKGG